MVVWVDVGNPQLIFNYCGFRASTHTTLAEFYFERLLPRASAYAGSMLSPSKSLMQLDKEHFVFN